MAGLMSFKVTVYQTNVDVLPMLQNKVRDLTGLFETIIQEWSKGNVDKFGMAVGKSSSGELIDPQVHWDALSPTYLKAKLRQGYPDAIMVRTGSLRSALTRPDGFFQYINPEQAVFGAPNDPEDALKVAYNWDSRQTIFLGDSDQNMIREKSQKYFTIEMQSIKQTTAQLDADFAATVGPQ